MTQQYCEECRHAQIDGPHDKYQGTMTSCDKKMPWDWDTEKMDYSPTITPCPCYQEDDLDHPTHDRDTMAALVEIDEMLKSGKITLGQIRKLVK